MLFEHGYWKTLECLAAFLLFSLLVLEITEETSLPVWPSSLQVHLSSNAAFFFLSPSSSVISSMSGNSSVRFGSLCCCSFFLGCRFFFVGGLAMSVGLGGDFRPFLLPLSLSLSPYAVVLQLMLLLGVVALFLLILGGGGLGFSSRCSRPVSYTHLTLPTNREV